MNLARRIWVVLAALACLACGSSVQAKAPAFEDVLLHELDVFFDARQERAEEFVDWTYGWAASYVYSYRAAARILGAYWDAPDAGWRANFLGTLRSFQHETIAERVTQPENSAAELSRLIDRYVAGQLFIRQSQLLDSICTNQPADTCNLDATRRLRNLAHEVAAERLEARYRAMETAEIADLIDIRDTEDVNLLHTARPITTRFLTFTLRLTELASLVVILSQALRYAYVPDTAITRSIIALLAAWGLDYAVLSAERYANKESFLAAIQTEIAAPRPLIETYVRKRIAAAEADFVNRSAPILTEFK